jgi:hypothetical protein
MSECETLPPHCNSINDDEQQLIKLCLKKPQKWNWQLSTSKSSSSVHFPTIQLFDEDNETLLVETSEANFCAGSKLRKSASVSKASSGKRDSLRALDSRSNFPSSIKRPITAETNESSDGEAAPLKRDPNPSAADASKETKRQHRIYSRSSSCRSRSSILKRIREFSELNHESSDDDDDNGNGKQEEASIDDNNRAREKEHEKKKYSMRTCNIGTILVPTESLSRTSRRRRRGSYPNANGEWSKNHTHTLCHIVTLSFQKYPQLFFITNFAHAHMPLCCYSPSLIFICTLLAAATTTTTTKKRALSYVRERAQLMIQKMHD